MVFDSLPLVSIIIPVYNAKSHLGETLSSINNQTYSKIEIIMIDDGSTDGSYQYLQTLNYPNVIVKRNKRKGASAARNYGIELAKGDYIQFLDADDIMAPNKISNQIKIFERYGNEIVCSCKWIRFWNSINEAKYHPQLVDKDYEQPFLWLKDSWLGGGKGCIHSWLTPRPIIEKAGFWDETLTINQDGEFFARVLLNAKALKFSEDTMVYYRSGDPNSLSQKNSSSRGKASSLLRSYILYKETVSKLGYIEELRKALGQNFLMFMYQYHRIFPDLSKKSEEQFKLLGFKKMWPVGGKRFMGIAHILGFKNTLVFTRILNGKF